MNPLLTACEEGDYAAFGAYADQLSEKGEEKLAAAFRWCAFRKKRPANRGFSGKVMKVKKPYAWFVDTVKSDLFYPDSWDHNTVEEFPDSVLPLIVFYGMAEKSARTARRTYYKFMDAMHALAVSLQSMSEALTL